MKSNPRIVGNQFGSDWTSDKLAILSKYLSAYTKALSKKNFTLHYIDGFAGSGYYKPVGLATSPTPIFEDEPILAFEEYCQGSCIRALETKPQFDHYHFIERKRKALNALKENVRNYDAKITPYHGDANDRIADIVNSINWRRSRAVMFLDPYGMNIDFETLRKVAATGAIDVWILCATAIGLNRMLVPPAEMSPAWRKRIDSFTGTEEWPSQLYKKVAHEDMFDGLTETEEKVDLDTVVNYYKSRLETVFPKVLPNPYVLRTNMRPLFHLFFAVGSENPKAQALAIRIANDITNAQRNK